LVFESVDPQSFIRHEKFFEARTDEEPIFLAEGFISGHEHSNLPDLMVGEIDFGTAGGIENQENKVDHVGFFLIDERLDPANGGHLAPQEFFLAVF